MITQVRQKPNYTCKKQSLAIKTGSMLRLSDKKIAERLASMPKKYRKIYTKAVLGRSRKAAMDALCLECTGWQRIEVKLCTATACPLYYFRAYQKML